MHIMTLFHYLNSDNNVYMCNSNKIFSQHFLRFVFSLLVFAFLRNDVTLRADVHENWI